MKKRISDLLTTALTHNATRSSLIVFVGMMLINITSYGYHVVVGRILGPEQYGELAALLSLLYILNVPTEVLKTTLIKYFSTLKAQKNLHQATYLFYWCTTRLMWVSGIGFLAVIPFTGVVAKFLQFDTTSHIVWLYIIFALMFLTTVNIGALLGLQRFTEAMIYGNVSAILRIIFGAIGALYGVSWTLIANVISNVLGYVAYFIPIRIVLPKKAEPMAITKRAMVSYSMPVFFATFGMMVIFSQDVVWVKHYFPSFDAGIYSSLAVLGKVIFFATNAIGLVVFPMVAERKELKQSFDELVLSAITAVGILASIITAVYFLFPSLVVGLLFGSSYQEAASYVGLFGVFLTFFSLSSVLTNICLAAGMTRVWIFTVVAAGAQLVGLLLFHGSLYQVIIVNSIDTGILTLLLLLYYHYARRLS